MKQFSLLDEKKVHPATNKKVIKAEEFSTLVDAHEILEETKKQSEAYRHEVAKECELLREAAEKAGFEEGLSKWNAMIAELENKITSVRDEMNKTIVPLALAAVEKILGKELKERPEAIVDLISSALKPVSQHRRITIYVNPQDHEIVEKNRPRIREIFEHLETLSIAPRADVGQGGVIIETEAGIINAQLESQLRALENAFRAFFQKEAKK